MRPELLTVGDRVALLFWDRGGRQPGVKARWLDADGRIGGMSVDVGAAKPGLFWPAMDQSPDGSGFWVAWQANPDKEGDDIFLRHLDPELQPLSPEVRATDYELYKGKTVKVGAPSVAVSGANLFVSYTLERDRQFVVERMRMPLTSPDLQTVGLQDKALAKGRHELGDTVVVNDDKVNGDYPAIACTKDACFLTWHEIDKGGAQAALVDPARGTILWRKRFAPHGSHPAVAVGPDGQVSEVRVLRAPVGSSAARFDIFRWCDGVGAAGTFAKTSGDPPRPWITAGRARGEWLVSWASTLKRDIRSLFSRGWNAGIRSPEIRLSPKRSGSRRT